uniref:Reverse transcriptase domain-containing protein n=1 Tax=Timema tahoe TaxID=61484 RepID=A0A7R9P008_9NEOP|nr:unnamed protein product [Timema tahoe]
MRRIIEEKGGLFYDKSSSPQELADAGEPLSVLLIARNYVTGVFREFRHTATPPKRFSEDPRAKTNAFFLRLFVAALLLESATLYRNEYAKDNPQWKGVLLNGRHKWQAYEDDIALMSQDKEELKQITKDVKQQAAKVELHLNKDKTEYMLMSRVEQDQDPLSLVATLFLLGLGTVLATDTSAHAYQRGYGCDQAYHTVHNTQSFNLRNSQTRISGVNRASGSEAGASTSASWDVALPEVVATGVTEDVPRNAPCLVAKPEVAPCPVDAKPKIYPYVVRPRAAPYPILTRPRVADACRSDIFQNPFSYREAIEVLWATSNRFLRRVLQGVLHIFLRMRLLQRLRLLKSCLHRVPLKRRLRQRQLLKSYLRKSPPLTPSDVAAVAVAAEELSPLSPPEVDDEAAADEELPSEAADEAVAAADEELLSIPQPTGTSTEAELPPTPPPKPPLEAAEAAAAALAAESPPTPQPPKLPHPKPPLEAAEAAAAALAAESPPTPQPPKLPHPKPPLEAAEAAAAALAAESPPTPQPPKLPQPKPPLEAAEAAAAALAAESPPTPQPPKLPQPKPPLEAAEAAAAALAAESSPLR